MRDKQIIIDGCDVSGCECYNPNIKMDCSLYPLQPDACKNNPNCNYKLYKRKEQECEELKHDNGYEVGALEKTIENLKAENETLFKAIEEVNKINKRLESENEELKEKINSLVCSENCYKYKQAEQYKQTLAEIKPIIEIYANSTIGTDKGNGIFEFELFNDNVLGGKLICWYDTNPAIKALIKINECESGYEV